MSDSAPEPSRPEVAPGTLAAAVGDTSGIPDAAPADESPAAAPESSCAAPATATEPAEDVPAAPDAAPSATPGATTGASPSADVEAPLQIDVTDPDAEALAAIPLPRRIEALLFASPEPLPMKRLKELTACPDGRAVRDAVDGLAAEYVAAGRAFRLEEVAQGWQIRTAGDVAPVVARLVRRPAEERLSAAAMETLAVVAYRQPVLRADVEKIRGVACGEVLRALQERALVRIAGRADLPGSPLLYGTTQRFLEIFGLRDIQDLPKDRELLRPAASES